MQLRFNLKNIFYILLSVFVMLCIFQSSTLPYTVPAFQQLCWKALPLLRVSFVGLALLFDNHKITVQKTVFVLIFLITFITTDHWAFFDLFFIGLFFEKIDYVKTLKCITISSVFSVLVIIALYSVHFLPSLDFIREDGTVRQSYGFLHPNTFGRIIMTLCISYILIRREKMKIYEYIIIIASGIFVYLVPNSITSALLIFLLVIGCMINRIYIKIKEKDFIDSKLIVRTCIAIIPIIITAFILIMVKYKNDFSFIANFPTTIQSRIKLGKVALDKYGVGLLGQKIELTSSVSILMKKTASKYFVIDCFYYYLPIQYGILAAIYFWYMYIRRMIKCTIEKDFYKFISCVILIIYCISENAVLSSLSIGFSFVFLDTDNKNQFIHLLKYCFKNKLKIKD